MDHALVLDSILAASDSDSIIKIVGGLIFLLIVMAGALSSGKKPKRPGEKTRTWEEILRDMADKATSKPEDSQPRSWEQILNDLGKDKTKQKDNRPQSPSRNTSTTHQYPATIAHTPPQSPSRNTSTTQQYPTTVAHAPPPLPQQRPGKPVQKRRKTAKTPTPIILESASPSPAGHGLETSQMGGHFPTAPSAGSISAPTAMPASSASAPQLRAQSLAKLLRPATLRQQILISEILRPPLSLRDEPTV